MKEFNYIITDDLGIHARPAGLLAKIAKSYPGTAITVTKGEKTVKATQLMQLMSLAVKQGEEITIDVEGPQEDEAAAAVKKYLEQNL